MRRHETVVLDEHLDIAMANALQKRLQPLISSPDDIVFDGSRINVIDTAGLQLLVAFVRERGAGVLWENPSYALRRAATLLGLETYLGLPRCGKIDHGI